MILERHNFEFRGTNQPSTQLRKDCWINVNLKATVKYENYEIKRLNFRVKSILVIVNLLFKDPKSSK